MALLLDRLTNKIGSFLGTNTTLPGPKSGGFSIQEFSSKVGEVDGILSTNLFFGDDKFTFFGHQNIVFFYYVDSASRLRHSSR